MPLLPQQSTWGQCDKQTWPTHAIIIADYEEEKEEGVWEEQWKSYKMNKGIKY